MDTTWPTSTRFFVLAMLILGVIWLAAVAAPLLQAIAVAALLAYLLDPAVLFLVRWTPLSRPWAAALVFLIALIFLLGIPAALGTVAVTSIRRLGGEALAAVDAIEQWVLQPVDILGFRLQPQDLLERLQEVLADLIASIPAGSLNVLATVTTNLLWAFVVIVMFYYFLKDGPLIIPWVVSLFPPAYRPEISRLLEEVDEVWGNFLRIQLVLFVLLSILLGVGTALLIILFRSGLIKLSPLGLILIIALFYIAVQQIDNLWIRPQILGRRLRLHPGLAFAGLLGALLVSGLFGALVVIPLIATAKVIGRYVHRKLLGLPPWPTDVVAADTEAVAEAPPVAAKAPLLEETELEQLQS